MEPKTGQRIAKQKTKPQVNASVSFRLFDFSICDREQDHLTDDDGSDNGDGATTSGSMSLSGSASSTPSPSPSKTAPIPAFGKGKEKIARL